MQRRCRRRSSEYPRVPAGKAAGVVAKYPIGIEPRCKVQRGKECTQASHDGETRGSSSPEPEARRMQPPPAIATQEEPWEHQRRAEEATDEVTRRRRRSRDGYRWPPPTPPPPRLRRREGRTSFTSIARSSTKTEPQHPLRLLRRRLRSMFLGDTLVEVSPCARYRATLVQTNPTIAPGELRVPPKVPGPTRGWHRVCFGVPLVAHDPHENQ